MSHRDEEEDFDTEEYNDESILLSDLTTLRRDLVGQDKERSHSWQNWQHSATNSSPLRYLFLLSWTIAVLLFARSSYFLGTTQQRRGSDSDTGYAESSVPLPPHTWSLLAKSSTELHRLRGEIERHAESAGDAVHELTCDGVEDTPECIGGHVTLNVRMSKYWNKEADLCANGTAAACGPHTKVDSDVIIHIARYKAIIDQVSQCSSRYIVGAMYDTEDSGPYMHGPIYTISNPVKVLPLETDEDRLLFWSLPDDYLVYDLGLSMCDGKHGMKSATGCYFVAEHGTCPHTFPLVCTRMPPKISCADLNSVGDHRRAFEKATGIIEIIRPDFGYIEGGGAIETI